MEYRDNIIINTKISDNEVIKIDLDKIKNLAFSKTDGGIILNIEDEIRKDKYPYNAAFKSLFGTQIDGKTFQELGFFPDVHPFSSYKIEILQNEAETSPGYKVIFDRLIGLRQENSTGHLENFSILEYDEYHITQTITLFPIYVSSVLYQHILKGYAPPNIQLIVIFGPKVKYNTDINYPFAFHSEPKYIYLSEYPDKILFPALDQLKAQGRMGTRLDILKLLHLPRIDEFDVEIYKKCCTYASDQKLFDSELSHEFFHLARIIYPKQELLSILDEFEICRT